MSQLPIIPYQINKYMLDVIKDFYKKLKFYYNLLGDSSLIEFEKLTIDRVRELVKLFDLIQKRPKIGVEEYQKIASNSLKREGWSFGEHLNLEKREHPLAGEFSELSSIDKIKQSVLLAIAKHHFLPSNKAVRQDISLHEENIGVSTGENLTETDEPTNTEDSI